MRRAAPLSLLSLLLGCAPHTPPDEEVFRQLAEAHLDPELRQHFLEELLARESRPDIRAELLLRLADLSADEGRARLQDGADDAQTRSLLASADRYYRLYLRDFPRAERADQALAGLAVVLTAQGRPAEAAAFWTQLLQQHPASVWAAAAQEALSVAP